MGRGSFLERGVRRIGRSLCHWIVFNLPEDFWKEVQDTAPDITIYEIASLMRVVGKDGMDEKTRSYIDFSQAFDDWKRATRWAAAVKAADERQKDEESLKSVARPRRKKQVSSLGHPARHDDDGSNERVDPERPQGRLTPEYLERRGRELGL